MDPYRSSSLPRITTSRHSMRRAPSIIGHRTTRKFLFRSVVIGVAWSWSSPAIPRLDGTFDPKNNPLIHGNITTSESAWIASLLALGSSGGPFLFGTLSDHIGRRTTLVWCSLPLYLHYVAEAFSIEVWHIYVARFVGGFATGAVFTVVPVYLGEMADAQVRGGIGCTMTLSVTVGVIFATAVGPYLTVKWFSLVCATHPIFFAVLTIYFVPESPVFLMASNQLTRAEKALRELRGCAHCEDESHSKHIRRELREIQKSIEETLDANITYLDLFRASVGVKRAIVITCGLMFCQQFSGINVAFSYMQTVFDASGSSLPPDVCSIVVSVLQTLACLSTALLADTLGRRMLLLTSAVGSFVAQIGMGTFFYLKDHKSKQFMSHLNWLPLASLGLFMVSYNLGFGPLGWTLLGEMFPPKYKAVASSLTAFCCLFLAFCTTFLFPHMVYYIRFSFSYWIFAVCCAISWYFIYRRVFETKRMSFKRIQRMLNDLEQDDVSMTSSLFVA